jgi:ribosomal protein S2
VLLFRAVPCYAAHLQLLQNGQVYVVENNQLLRPLIKTAALSCINPNVWFDHRTWSPGTLTNYASSRRLFKESHQPNRR